MQLTYLSTLLETLEAAGRCGAQMRNVGSFRPSPHRKMCQNWYVSVTGENDRFWRIGIGKGFLSKTAVLS